MKHIDDDDFGFDIASEPEAAMQINRELDLARRIVEETGANLFLTGKAGTGKTTFLNWIPPKGRSMPRILRSRRSTPSSVSGRTMEISSGRCSAASTGCAVQPTKRKKYALYG